MLALVADGGANQWAIWATHFRAPMLLALQGPDWVDGWVSVVLRVHGVCACA